MDLQAFELVIAPHPRRGRPRAEPARPPRLLRPPPRRGHGGHRPLLDQPDESLRALAAFRTGSLDTTRRLAEQDPAVRARRFTVEVMTYWCNPGTMTLPGRPLTVPDP